MGRKKAPGCHMAIRQALQLFALALAGATLAGCVEHTAAGRATLRGASPRASPAGRAPRRGASLAPPPRGGVASKNPPPSAARPTATKLAALTDSSVGI